MIVPYGLAPQARIMRLTESPIIHRLKEKHYEMGNPGSD